MVEKIVRWAAEKPEIKTLLLVGSRAHTHETDQISDYDISVFCESFHFIDTDTWLNDIEMYWLCVHDSFTWNGQYIPTRLVIFDNGVKVDFAFHHLSILNQLITSSQLPDTYDAGYKVLLDKSNLTKNLSSPSLKSYLVSKPTPGEFETAVNEFWFEAWHVGKYLYRNDLWVSKFRDWNAKTWLLQMLQWNAAAKSNWKLSAKPDGKHIRNWLDPVIYKKLETIFSHFDKQESVAALWRTIDLFRETANETASLLNYSYNSGADSKISAFINDLLNSSNESQSSKSHKNH